MTNRVHVPNLKRHEEDEDLRFLLEKYLQRAEELENRENKVLKQIELMQSAVSSLQDWNESRKASRSSSEPVKIDVDDIEEETKLIREETKRIQKEIEEKKEENERLEEEIMRRKTQQSEDLRMRMSELESSTSRRNQTVSVPNRKATQRNPPGANPGIDFFDVRLQKLKQMEQKMIKESGFRSDDLKRKQKNLQEKVEMLEWESRIDKQLIDTLRKKNNDKK